MQPVTDAYKRLFPFLIQNGFQHALVLATASWVAPEDHASLKWRLISGLVRIFVGDAWADINETGNYISSLSLDKIKWTIFRVPFLNDAAHAQVDAGYLGGSKNVGLKLSRSSLASWVLQELDKPSWIGQAPCLWNC